MTTDEAQLLACGRQTLSDLQNLLVRLARLDAAAVVRLRRSGDRVGVWAQPLGVVVRRELQARMTVTDRTVPAADLLVALDASGRIRLPEPRERAWRVSLPPRDGWAVLDDVPSQVFRDLAGSAGRVVRSARDPIAAGQSLLDRDSLRVSDGTEEVVLPMRVVVVLNRMGFLGPGEPLEAVVRVTCTAAWTRLVARHGTAYQRRPGLGLSLA